MFVVVVFVAAASLCEYLCVSVSTLLLLCVRECVCVRFSGSRSFTVFGFLRSLAHLSHSFVRSFGWLTIAGFTRAPHVPCNSKILRSFVLC